MVRRRRSLTLLLLGALLLTGCWGRLEVNDVGLVTGIAVDQGQGDNVRVGLFIARGLGGAKTGPAHWLIQAEARTMPDAIRHIARTSSRRIILDHVRVIVVGERYARTGTGFADLMDFIGRHSEIRLTPRLLLAEGEAIEVMGVDPHLEAEQPEALSKKLEAKAGLNPMLKDILIATIAETHSPWFYTVAKRGNTIKTKGHQEAATEIDGIALTANNLLVDILPIDETRAFALMMQHPEDAELSVPCLGEPDLRFSVRLEKGKTKIIPTLNGNQPAFHVKTQVKAILINSECQRSNIDVTGNRQRFEEALRAQGLMGMEKLIKRMQRVKADPVAFGKVLQVRYPAFFRQNALRWPEIWAQSPVTIELKVSLHHSNLLLDPITKTRAELRAQQQ